MASSVELNEPLQAGDRPNAGFAESMVTTSAAIYGGAEARSRLSPLGTVRGITVRSRNIGADLAAGLKSLAGGELTQWTALCETAREEALVRMLDHARSLGATGVLNIRYDTNSIGPGITEVIAYGSAVSTSDPPAGSGPGAGELDGRLCSLSSDLPGYEIKRNLGVVQGLTVRSRAIGMQIGAGLKSLAGGEIKTYTELCEKARDEALARMFKLAMERGANGVIGMRYDTNDVMPNVVEVLAFGTAVSSEPPSAAEQAMLVAEEGMASHFVTTANALPEGVLAASQQRSLGVAQGLTVMSKNAFSGIGAGLKSLVGGEVGIWSDLCEKTRCEAFKRMIAHANAAGAKGIVAMRYDTNVVSQGMVEVLAFGTMVADGGEPAAAVADNLRERITTADKLVGHEATYAGNVVRGISVQTCNVFLTIGAGFKGLVGGEIRNFTRMCESTREEAFKKMVEHAKEQGAQGVVGFRYDSVRISENMVEVMAYGTAVHVAPKEAAGLLMSTANDVPGHDVSVTCGIVRGITVRSRNVFSNIGAGFKAMVGGEIHAITQLCEDAREQAMQRMLEHARERGAQGILALRFECNDLADGISEVIAYGTSCKVSRRP